MSSATKVITKRVERTAGDLPTTRDVEWQRAAVDRVNRHFAAAGNNLGLAAKEVAEIHQRGAWKATHKSFQDFCSDQFIFAYSRVRQLLVAHDVQTQVRALPAGDRVPIPNERVARVIASASTDPEQRAKLWTKVVEASEKQKVPVTRKFVETIVKPTHKANSKPKATREDSTAAIVAATEDAPATSHQMINVPHSSRVTKDKTGRDIDSRHKWVVAAFEDVPAFEALRREVSQLKGDFRGLANGPGGRYAEKHLQAFNALVDSMLSNVRFVQPYAVCPYCGGEKCDSCRQQGFMPEDLYNAVPADVRAAAGDGQASGKAKTK